MQKRALENKKIEMVWDSVLEDAVGDQFVTAARIKNVKTNEVKELAVAGIFYAIGHTPNTQPFKGQIDLDETGYIKVKLGTQETNVEGVFAAGDVHDHKYRQAVTAAGTGCAAALEAERWLGEQGIA
jgi:thioredoxin reductase (NADPH)